MKVHCVGSLTALVIGLVSYALSVTYTWAYDVVAVQDGGAISGQVTFAGEPPAPEMVPVSKDTQVCGQEKIDRSLLVGAENGIKNVAVSITDIARGKARGEGGTLDQKECVYTPHVVLSPAGAELTILNSDGILHNIHTYSDTNPPLNRAQPKFNKKMTETFAQPETVRLACDVHAWMSGWLIVTEHPYYAVTDETGHFSLTDVPPGDYELKFWHETLGETTRKVAVKANGETTLTVEMAKQ